MASDQLPLPFPHQPTYAAADFLAAPSNEAALTWLGNHPATFRRVAERLLRHALKQSEHVPLAYRGLAPALVHAGPSWLCSVPLVGSR